MQNKTAPMKDLSETTKSFMKKFGLEYPIIQASMDGAATPPLVSAVANAGGFGALPLGFRSPPKATKQIKEVQETTNGPFMVNFVMNFPALAFPVAMQAGVETFLFSWGLPSPSMLNQMKKAGCKIGIQVSDANGALQAMKLDPDFLVCQGLEAGGHVQGNMPLIDALTQVLDKVTDSVPVVASGGIATGKNIHQYLQAGAAAVIMGTRFIATQESAAHQHYKEKLIKAQGPADTVLTVCLNKIWPNATHRLLRSSTTFQMWESEGRPPGPTFIPAGLPGGPVVGNRPGEHDIVAIDSEDNAWERYVDLVPVESMRVCDVNAMGVFAGEGVGEISDVPTVAELMQRLVAEYNQYVSP